MERRVVLLGSTGSIGRQALDVLRLHREELKCVALACMHGGPDFDAQVLELKPEAVCLGNEASMSLRQDGLRVYRGPEGLVQMVRDVAADTVLNGIAGSAGMPPSMAVVEKGGTLALANKESVVMAGPLLMNRARERGACVLPVDSEHHGVWSLLKGRAASEVAEIVLTASGGALRDVALQDLPGVLPQDALAHPTWAMGPKITIDSATLANKGLEVIEAHYLFDVAADRVRVVIHPQSLVHALVRLSDGALYAQMSRPDMRLPIQSALLHPQVPVAEYGRLELEGVTIDFHEVDSERYPLLDLAYEALARGMPAPIVFNAANEVAVAEFLAGHIGYTDIGNIVAEVLSREWGKAPTEVAEVEGVHESACAAAAKTARSIA